MTTPLDSSNDFPAPFQAQNSTLKDNPISPRRHEDVSPECLIWRGYLSAQWYTPAYYL